MLLLPRTREGLAHACGVGGSCPFTRARRSWLTTWSPMPCSLLLGSVLPLFRGTENPQLHGKLLGGTSGSRPVGGASACSSAASASCGTARPAATAPSHARRMQAAAARACLGSRSAPPASRSANASRACGAQGLWELAGVEAPTDGVQSVQFQYTASPSAGTPTPAATRRRRCRACKESLIG